MAARTIVGMALLAACAVHPAPTPQRASDAVLDEWVARRVRSTAPTIQVAAAEHRSRAQRTSFRTTVTEVRASSDRRIHVSFRQAPLTEALRLLADEAQVNLVIADDLQGEVSVRLHAVRPYDAMLALAEAHGADVSRRGDLVIVRPR